MARKLSVLLVAAVFLILFTSPSKADELLDVQNQINQKTLNSPKPKLAWTGSREVLLVFQTA